MLPIKAGVLPTTIGMGEYIVKCPCCETDSWAEIIVTSNYYHFFYVPVFPVGKEANIYCKKCDFKRYGAAFDAGLIKNYDEIKSLYKHPWYTYIGIGCMAFVIAMIVVFSGR